MRRFFAGSTALLIAGLGGCEVGPNYHTPHVPLPNHFSPSTTQPSTQPATAELTQWWQSFHDPTLNRLIARGIAANYDVQLAEARVRQARAQLEYEMAGLFPTVDALASFLRSRTSDNLAGVGKNASSGSGSGTSSSPGFALGTHNLYQVGFDAGWEIDVFGGGRRAIEAANASLQAQVEARRDALVTLLSEVANDYVLLRGYQHQLQIVRDNAQAQRHTLNIQKKRLHAGLATALTIAQAEAQVASTESAIPPLETLIEQMIQSLAVLLNLPPDQIREDLGPDGPLPAGPNTVPPGLPSELVRRRPDVRQAERQLAASNANIGVATSELFPQFSLTGTLGLESAKLTSLASAPSAYWSGGPQVTWRIFDAGQLLANVRIQNAVQKQSLVTYEKSVIQSFADVNNALTAFNREQSHRQYFATAVEANRRAVDLSLKMYDAGVVDFLTVLTAQESYYQTQSQLAQSEQTVSTDLIALYKALGGGWETTDQPATKAAESNLGPDK